MSPIQCLLSRPVRLHQTIHAADPQNPAHPLACPVHRHRAAAALHLLIPVENHTDPGTIHKFRPRKIKNNPVNIIFRQKQVCFIFECQAVMVIYLLRQMNHQRRIDRFVCKHISFHIRIPPFSIFYAACFCFARVRIIGTLVPFCVIGNSKEFPITQKSTVKFLSLQCFSS